MGHSLVWAHAGDNGHVNNSTMRWEADMCQKMWHHKRQCQQQATHDTRLQRQLPLSFPGCPAPFRRLAQLYGRWLTAHVNWRLGRFPPWPDDSRNVWFAQAYQTIHTGWCAQKRGWFAHWWWWFVQARLFVMYLLIIQLC